MAGKDMNTIERDMLACIDHVISTFKGRNVPLEAAPIAQLAEIMFNDHRGNNERDIATQQAAASKELLKLELEHQITPEEILKLELEHQKELLNLELEYQKELLQLKLEYQSDESK